MKKIARAIFFTDAGKESGYGHLSRCQVLSNAFKAKGIPNMFFVHSKEKVNVKIDAPVTYFDWETIDFSQHIKSHDLCIVDSYIVKPEQESQIAGLAAKVLFIDDFGNYDHPGLVLNYSLNLKESANNNPRLLLGPKYTLLKEPFASFDSNYRVKEKVTKVLITLGGSTLSKTAYEILDILAPNYPNISFKAIVLKKRTRYDLLDNVELLDFCSPHDLLNQMLKSDLIILAPSQTLYEVIRLKIPFIAIQTAANQSNNVIKDYNNISKICEDINFNTQLNSAFEKLQMFEERFKFTTNSTQIKNSSDRVINRLLDI